MKEPLPIDTDRFRVWFRLLPDLPSSDTLSDATAGGIEKDSITFSLCRDHVDDFVLLRESEIAQGIRLVFETEHMTIEGGAALTVAALLKKRTELQGKKVVLIISGKRIEQSKLEMILTGN